MNKLLVAIGVLSFSAHALSAQSIHIVDALGAPGTFLNVNAAVSAATSGDLILVKPGTYSSFAVNNQSITIVADGRGVIITEPPGLFAMTTGVVSNLSANDYANLAGFDFVEIGGLFGNAILQVANCAGPVQIRDCTVNAGSLEALAARVADSQAVNLVDLELDASLTGLGYADQDNAHALVTEDSSAFVYNSTLIAGHGIEGDVFCPQPFHGGPGPSGWRIRGGFGLGRNNSIVGGPGGDGILSTSTLSCGRGGDGGPAIELLAGQTATQLVSSQQSLTGGAAGIGGGILTDSSEHGTECPAPVVGFECFDGLPGPELLLTAGTSSNDDFAPRSLSTESLVRVGAQKSERFTGQPADLIFHIFGLNPSAPVFIPEVTGALVVGNPYFLRFRGIVPASGEKVLTFPVPEIGVDFAVLYEQAYFFDGARFIISNPQFSVIVDDAF